jgi:hypothetical protein
MTLVLRRASRFAMFQQACRPSTTPRQGHSVGPKPLQASPQPGSEPHARAKGTGVPLLPVTVMLIWGAATLSTAPCPMLC